jgi:TonB family protein
MNALLIYMIKTAVYLAGFFLVFRLFLSRDTLYGRNRIYILMSVISSLVLPLITIQTIKPLVIPVFGKVLSEILVTGNSASTSTISDNALMAASRWMFVIYVAGVIIFGIKLAIDCLELVFLVIRQRTDDSRIIRFQGLNTAGFSAFGHIFINKQLTSGEAEEIIRHEQNHLDQNHSFDIVLLETVKVFQWFNPVIHMFSRSLRAVHEFQADEKCINLGMSINYYQRLMMNQVFKSKIFTVTNSFSNPSLIKRRMIMMTKKRSNALANFKLLMVLPVIALAMVVISSCQANNNSSEPKTEEMAPPPPPPPPPVAATDTSSTPPFVEVDEMAVFPGGDAGLIDFIKNNTKYPEMAKTAGTQGKVIVRFAVEPDGKVDRISILKGVDPELDMEAFRVVSTMPAFEKPGIKDGKKVPVWYMVPINFRLQ